MAEKRVSVRLAASGGRQVKAELEGIGEGGSKSFRNLSRETDDLNRRLAAFAKRAAVVATAAATAAIAAGTAIIRNGLQVVDAQAKLAQSLDTTVESVQVLERAGELAGVAFSGIEQATKDLTRRLSQAAAGTGPAVDALERLNLSAEELMGMPLDERVRQINAAIEAFVPAAERAAVAGQLFGEEGSIAISRVDTTTLQQAADDVRRFGVAVSEADADQIERTNDAISRLGLVGRGLANQLTTGAAPAIERVADAIAALTEQGSTFNTALSLVVENIDKVAFAAGALATILSVKLAASATVAAAAFVGLTGPIGVAVALLGLGGAAFLAFRDGAETVETPVDEAKVALNLLNEAMGTFSSSSAPSAQGAALNTAIAYRDQASAAIAAAEAELALMQAELSRQRSAPMEGAEGGLLRDMVEDNMADDIAFAEAEIDSLRKSLDLARVRIRQAAGEITSQMTPAMVESAESTQKLKIELAGLDELLAKLRGAGGSVPDVIDGVTELGNRMEQVRDQMASAFASIVTGSESARDAISNLLNSFASTLANRAFQSLFGSLLGAPVSVPGFASGTSFAPGGLALVGERGPELVNLPRGSQVFSAERSRQMAGGGVSISIDARGAQEGVASQIERAIARRLPDLQRAAIASVAGASRRGY